MRYTGRYMPCTGIARERRTKDGFFQKYCNGKILDIGPGCDKILPNAEAWDQDLGHGDAMLMEGVADNSYDTVYSSHCLEHLPDLELALKNWWRLVKPGGHLILSVPHRNLYEQKRELPSRMNTGHYHFFLIERDEAPHTVGLVPLIGRVCDESDLICVKKCDYAIRFDDGTFEPEFSIEAVIRKIHPDDYTNYRWMETH